MKYCTNCGTQLEDNVAFCPNCGTRANVAQQTQSAQPEQPAQTAYTQQTQQTQQTYSAQPAYTQPAQQTAYTQAAPRTEKKFTGLQTATLVFMIISTVAMGWTLIPLAWCIPMTVTYYNCIKYGRPVSMALKICTLLFVSPLSGIFMLVDSDAQ